MLARCTAGHSRIPLMSALRERSPDHVCAPIHESFRLVLTREPPLQDDRRRRAVDVFFPHTTLALTAGALSFQRRARLERGPALIHPAHGKTEAALELGREPMCSRRERTRATVRIIRR